MSSSAKTSRIVIGFVILVLGFFYQTVFWGKLPVPSDTLVGLYHPWRDLYAQTNPRGVPFKNFLITDPIRQQIPWRKTAIDTWKSGHIPGWNPYTFGGVPLDANIQAAALYPLNILFIFLPFSIAWTMLIMIQPLIAGLLLYAYLRHSNLGVWASAVGAIAWSFCGFSIAWLTWGTIVQTAMWIPLLLLCIDQLLRIESTRHNRNRWIVVTIMTLFFMVSAGHSQVMLYGIVLSIAYALVRTYAIHHTRPLQKKSLVRLIGVGFIGLCVCAPIWLPQLSFLPHTTRLLHTTDHSPVGWFVPWQHLVQFIAPDFFGNPATLNYWGVWNYGEFIGYIGMVPLLLALVALSGAGRTRFWALTLAVALFFMLPHPITEFLRTLEIPLVGTLQPTRLMMIIDLALCILAAYGVEKVQREDISSANAARLVGVVLVALWGGILIYSMKTISPEWIEKIQVAKHNLLLPTLVYLGAIVLFGAAKKLSPRYRTHIWTLLLILTIFDLFRFGWKFTPFTSSEYFFPKTKIIEFLQKQPKPFRIASIDDRIMPPNVSSWYGIETIEGYDPLVSARFENFLVASERGKADLHRPTGFNRIYTIRNLTSPLFPLLNVRYVLSLEKITSAQWSLVFQEGETYVYQNNLLVPRVYLAGRIEVLKDTSAQSQIQSLFSQSGNDLPALVEHPISVLSLPLTADESAAITAYEPNRITIQTKTINPRLLVFLNSFDAKWQARIDTKKASIIHVNYLFMGVVVPAGSHTLQLVY